MVPAKTATTSRLQDGLSALRDADAVISTLERVGREFPERISQHTLARMRRELARAKKRRVADARKHRRVAHVADILRVVRRSAAKWAVPPVDPLDLPQLVKASYRAARKAMRLAQKTGHPSDLHRWRKHVKTLWYQLRLLQGSAAARFHAACGTRYRGSPSCRANVVEPPVKGNVSIQSRPAAPTW